MPLSPPRGSTAGSRPTSPAAPGLSVDYLALESRLEARCRRSGAHRGRRRRHHAPAGLASAGIRLSRRGIGRVPGRLAARTSHPPAPPTGLRLTVLDVGQGDAILLQVPEGSILVDQGPPRRGRRPGPSTRHPPTGPARAHPSATGPNVGGAAGVATCASGPSWIRRSRTRARTRQQRSRPRARRVPIVGLGPESSSGSAGFGSSCSGPTALTRRASIPTSVPR